jgi:hypothetical protein
MYKYVINKGDWVQVKDKKKKKRERERERCDFINIQVRKNGTIYTAYRIPWGGL